MARRRQANRRPQAVRPLDPLVRAAKGCKVEEEVAAAAAAARAAVARVFSGCNSEGTTVNTSTTMRRGRPSPTSTSTATASAATGACVDDPHCTDRSARSKCAPLMESGRQSSAAMLGCTRGMNTSVASNSAQLMSHHSNGAGASSDESDRARSSPAGLNLDRPAAEASTRLTCAPRPPSRPRPSTWPGASVPAPAAACEVSAARGDSVRCVSSSALPAGIGPRRLPGGFPLLRQQLREQPPRTLMPGCQACRRRENNTTARTSRSS